MEEGAYSKHEFILAINVSAVLGWAAFTTPAIYVGGFLLLPWAAIFGLPVAFAACWLIAAPMLKRLMHQSISWAGAVKWGAIISAVMSLIYTIIGETFVFFDRLNPNTSSQVGEGEFIYEADGLMSVFGLQVLVQQFATFMTLGVLIALFLRAVIGPGRK